MLLVPVFLIFMSLDKNIWAFAVFVIASLSDFADGFIARKFNQISVFGKFMDPLADKVLVLSAMCVFIEKGYMPGWAVAIVLFREFSVSGLRLIAVEKGSVIAAGISGKIKTASTMIFLCLILLFPIPVHCIAGTVAIVLTTVWSGLEYFIRNRAVFKV